MLGGGSQVADVALVHELEPGAVVAGVALVELGFGGAVVAAIGAVAVAGSPASPWSSSGAT